MTDKNARKSLAETDNYTDEDARYMQMAIDNDSVKITEVVET